MGKKQKTNEEFLREVYEKNEYVRNGEIEILSEYAGVNTKIKCRCTIHDWIYWVVPSSLLKNIGCKRCGYERMARSHIKAHEQFVEELREKDDSIIVIGQYTGVFNKMDFMCSKGHIFSMTPNSILNGYGCPYCSGRKVLIGYNDLNSTHPHIKRFLLNEGDGAKYTAGSRQKIMFRCPDCGKEQLKEIYLVVREGFSCRNCSDHLSYPSRFGRAFFDQLQVEYYDTEWQPDWAKPYYYDLHFEIDMKHFIVEWDGQFHFEKEDKFGISFADRQERDRIKNELAFANNVHMIRVNCAESNCDYIKNNIIQSELSNLFDLSNIDWKLCDKESQKTLVKAACDLYMSGTTSFKDICATLHIGDSTARSYIKRGAALGWCDYDLQKKNQNKIDRQSNSVVVTDTNTGAVYNFNSIRACERESRKIFGIKLYRDRFIEAFKVGRPYNGFMFEIDNLTIQN